MSFIPPSQGYVLATATSIGTSTTKTQLNAAVDLRLPTVTNAVNEIVPFYTPGTQTAGESINASMIIESNSVFVNPTRFQVPVITAGVGAFTTGLHPILSSYRVNIPVASAAGPALTISGQALQSNTSAPKMGAILNVTNKGTAGRQIFWQQRNGVTLGATTAGSVTETTYQVNNCERLVTAIAAAAPLVVTVSESVSGNANFTSPDFQSTIPVVVTITPLVSSPTTAAPLNASQPQWNIDIPTNPVCNLSPVYTNDKTLTAAVNYTSCVAFYQLGR